MRFKLRQMEVFRAVMLTGSMNGAAKLLFISQPAVSRLIAYTEQHLGLLLFERSKGKLRPTAEAEVLFREVGGLFDEALRIDELARDLASVPQGALTVCCSPSLALHFVPRAIAGFLLANPNVRLKFHTTLLSDMALELLGRKAEIGVSVLPIDHPNLVSEPLTTGRMLCLLPDGHPLAAQPVLGLAEIATHPLVLYSRAIPFGQLIASALQKAGVSWRTTVDIERAEQAFALVRAGVGLSIVDEFSAAHGAWSGVAVRPLKEVIPLTISLARSRFDTPSRQVQAFVKTLKQQVETRSTPSAALSGKNPQLQRSSG